MVEPMTPYRDGITTQCTFSYSTPVGRMARIASPCFWVLVEILVAAPPADDEAEVNYLPPVANDRVQLKTATSFIRSLRLSINNQVAPLTYPTGDSLSRLCALNARTSPARFDAAPELVSMSPLRNSRADFAKAAAGQSKLCEELINRGATAGQNKMLVPIAIPLFPFGGLGLISQMDGLEELEESKMFCENQTISVTVTVDSQAVLDQVSQLKTTLPAEEGGKLLVKLEVEKIWMAIDEVCFNPDSAFLKGFRSFRSKNALRYPVITAGCFSHNLQPGVGSETVQVPLGSHKIRAVAVYFHRTDDGTAKATEAANTTEFYIPSDLATLTASCGDLVLAGTPSESKKATLHNNQVDLYTDQIKYLTVKCDIHEYFGGYNPNRVLILNLDEALNMYSGVAIPPLKIKLDWSVQKSPQNMILAAFVFERHVLSITRDSQLPLEID